MGDNRIYINGVDPSYERELAARSHGKYSFFAGLAFTLFVVSVIVFFFTAITEVLVGSAVFLFFWLVFRTIAKFLKAKLRL